EFRAPTTPVEEIVADTFADVLGVERVGLDDEFFALGGNSLIAVQTASVLRKKLGVEVHLPWFFDSPSVAVLADRISSSETVPGADSRGFDVLLPLRAEGKASPLFCIHPVTGLSWSFAGLVGSIEPNRPVYGLQSPALSGDRELPASIEEWASLYVDEIRRVQPSGPYHLLGWSMGGEIAHAMAIQLTAAGDEVALLAMLDSHLASDSHTAKDGDVATEGAADHRGTAPRIADMLGGLGIQLGDTPSLDELDRETAVEALQELLLPVGRFDAEQIDRVVAGFVHSSVVANAYRPTDRFKGDVLYFSADLDGSHGADAWSGVVEGDVEVVPVAVTHWDMTSPEALRVIGPVLERRLKS
ncbi:thioesterase domain-containing protein, partial [Rhodococcus xishaensis]